MDAFIDKLDLQKLGFTGTVHKSEGRPPYAPPQQLNNTADKQISATDPDSRSILIPKRIVEVAYNIQNVVDDKHNLIVQTQGANTYLPALVSPLAMRQVTAIETNK